MNMSILTRLSELEERVQELESGKTDFKYSRDKNVKVNYSQDISIIKDMIGIDGGKDNHELQGMCKL